MKALIFYILLMVLTFSANFAQTPPVEAGVSQTLAKWRAANYSDVRYKLNITLEKGASLMKGEIEIRVNLTETGAKNNLILDWRTTQFANDKDKPFADVVAVNDTTGAQASRLQTSLISGVKNFASNQDELNPNALSLRSLQAGTLALQSNEHLIIPKDLLKTGENNIKIQFASPIKTSGAAITRYVDKEDGAEYVYSLFVPSDASTAFPVFDQPDLKATFQLDATVPYGWKVINNSAEEDYGGMIEDANRKIVRREFHFEVTKPISTYVFAFAAGEFEEFRGEIKTDAKYPPDLNESLDVRGNAHSRVSATNIYVRKSQAEKFKTHEKEVFRLNREGVKFLENYFDYKFPFPKYDLVLIPEFPFGGMEHAGATFLREASIIFPSEPTKNDYVSRANLIFHEAAHQWFGDTVTMKWFDDLWLKEGFAEFMAYKTLAQVMPEYNAWKIFYERNKQAAYLTDSTKGTTPIYQEIPNLSAAKSAYGNIVYRKAPSFLKQAEFYLGEKDFQTAVRQFLRKHEFANAEWSDLVSEFKNVTLTNLKKSNANLSSDETKKYEESVNKKIDDWAETWVKQGGAPIVNFKVLVGKPYSGSLVINNSPQIKFQQKTNSGAKRELESLFNVLIGYKGEKVIQKISLPTKDYTVLVAPKDFFTNRFRSGEMITPDFVFPNYQDYGYGIFLLDEKSRDYVLKNIQTEKDDFLRTMMWGSLWDSVREAELAPKDYVELVIKNLAVESDESTIQTLLGRVGTAMNYYLSEPSAVADGLTPQSKSSNAKLKPPATAGGSDLKARLEAVLVERIANAKTPGQRITFYRAYLNLASSATAAKNLKDILAGKSKIAVFQLKTKDKFDIVTRLLVMGDKDAPALLAGLEKTESSDEAKRYAYAARAGIGSADTKAKYFRDFLTDKDLSESWIEAAFVPFNSVRHSDLTSIYLETALAELPNLKRNRKIFFINGWLGAFIGGQKSEESLAIVNKFLADNPNLDKDLRLKILENADGLERAVKIRLKYGK